MPRLSLLRKLYRGVGSVEASGMVVSGSDVFGSDLRDQFDDKGVDGRGERNGDGDEDGTGTWKGATSSASVGCELTIFRGESRWAFSSTGGICNDPLGVTIGVSIHVSDLWEELGRGCDCSGISRVFERLTGEGSDAFAGVSFICDKIRDNEAALCPISRMGDCNGGT